MTNAEDSAPTTLSTTAKPRIRGGTGTAAGSVTRGDIRRTIGDTSNRGHRSNQTAAGETHRVAIRGKNAASRSRRRQDPVDAEERLLWRNETRLDDDFVDYNGEQITDHAGSENNPKDHHNSTRPGLVVSALLDHSTQNEAPSGVAAMSTPENSNTESSSDTHVGSFGTTDTTTGANQATTAETVEIEMDLVDDLGENEYNFSDSNTTDDYELTYSEEHLVLLDEEFLFSNTTEALEEAAVQESSGSENTPSEADIVSSETVNGDSDDDSRHNNQQLDCLWRILTGTSCTSGFRGDIVQGYQHEYLVADGECRYNDFVGYYRAGCKRPTEGGSDGPSGISASGATSTTNRAKVVLTDVFCTDPACSTGCLEDSAIRPDASYVSNFCYLSYYYKGNTEAFSRNGEHNFSFEFIGGCLESENCKVVE